jgi:hypothetical protein
MPSALLAEYPIPEHDWLSTRPPEENGRADEERGGGRWDETINALAGVRELEDNWDGLGASAPPPALLDSAVGLAYLLRGRGMSPPDRVVAGTAGTVILEWQDPDGTYCEVEIDRPFHADVMLLVPGRPAKHWELPNA